MKSIKNVKRIIMIAITVSFCVWIVWELLISTYGLTCTHYEVQTDKIDAKIRIVQLSDLHNSEFGKDNEKLIETVKVQSPDLILLTGDMLDSRDEDTSIATTLIKNLKKIAPVYFSYGNHEDEYENTYGVKVTSLFEEAGAKVLDQSFEDIEIQDQTVRLGGIYGYCLPEKYLETHEADPEECEFLNEFQNTDLYTILLCHMPACWIVNDGINGWDVDCIFAGHAHGGQIRLPFIGGLWAPDQGWFPGEEAGLYYSDNHKKVMVLSRGLGSTEIVPRFNNEPEIVVVDVYPIS